MSANDEKDLCSTWQRRIKLNQIVAYFGLLTCLSMKYIIQVSLTGENDQSGFILLVIAVISIWLTDTVISLIRHKEQTAAEDPSFIRTTKDLIRLRLQLTYAAMVFVAAMFAMAVYKAATISVTLDRTVESLPAIAGAVIFGIGIKTALNALTTLIEGSRRQAGR